MTPSRWALHKNTRNLPLMQEVLGISRVLAATLSARGIQTKRQAQLFLYPTAPQAASHLGDGILGIKEAAQIILAAVRGGKKIAVYGDYDADGIMSTATMLETLAALGAKATYYMPHRVREGYGITERGVRSLHDSGVDLIIAVDCGISTIAEAALIRDLGMQLIIIDHHEPTPGAAGDILPHAAAIINPKQRGCPYPFKEMCAAALCMITAREIFRLAKIAMPPQIKLYAAIATICDVVPLLGDNRHIAASGLADGAAHSPGLFGLAAFAQAAPLCALSVGFKIGPMLNAAGRLSSARLAVRLLLATADEHRQIDALVGKLSQLNEQRKKMTKIGTAAALEAIGENPPKIVVMLLPNLHESIAGIVAGRVREAIMRPTIILTNADGTAKGSGRSVPGYNMFEALSKNAHLLTKFGGHNQAAGISMPPENVQALSDALNAQCSLHESDFVHEIKIDCEISADEITLQTAQELERLAPFGSKNRQPLFLCRSIMCQNARVMDAKNTVIFTFHSANGPQKGIAFGLNDKFNRAAAHAPPSPNGLAMDIVFHLEPDAFTSGRSCLLKVVDFELV